MPDISKFVMEHFIDIASMWLMPAMGVAFLGGLMLRSLIWYTVGAENRFSKEFDKRVQKYLGEVRGDRITSFHKLLQHLLHQTYYECFELKNKYRRRNLDFVTSLTDRLFMIQDGVTRASQELLKRSRHFRKDSGAAAPKMLELCKGVFDMNPVFNRVMGILPVGLFNDLLNILPGLFVIGGIFGTFLGIVKGLPELGGMDLSNSEETKRIMDMFLLKIAYSMIASIVGIFLSVLMSIINTMFSAENLYVAALNRFSSSLEYLWNETSSNEWAEEPGSKGPANPYPSSPHSAPHPVQAPAATYVPPIAQAQPVAHVSPMPAQPSPVAYTPPVTQAPPWTPTTSAPQSVQSPTVAQAPAPAPASNAQIIPFPSTPLPAQPTYPPAAMTPSPAVATSAAPSTLAPVPPTITTPAFLVPRPVLEPSKPVAPPTSEKPPTPKQAG